MRPALLCSFSGSSVCVQMLTVLIWRRMILLSEAYCEFHGEKMMISASSGIVSSLAWRPFVVHINHHSIHLNNIQLHQFWIWCLSLSPVHRHHRHWRQIHHQSTCISEAAHRTPCARQNTAHQLPSITDGNGITSKMRNPKSILDHEHDWWITNMTDESRRNIVPHGSILSPRGILCKITSICAESEGSVSSPGQTQRDHIRTIRNCAQTQSGFSHQNRPGRRVTKWLRKTITCRLRKGFCRSNGHFAAIRLTQK